MLLTRPLGISHKNLCISVVKGNYIVEMTFDVKCRSGSFFIAGSVLPSSSAVGGFWSVLLSGGLI